MNRLFAVGQKVIERSGSEHHWEDSETEIVEATDTEVKTASGFTYNRWGFATSGPYRSIRDTKYPQKTPEPKVPQPGEGDPA